MAGGKKMDGLVDLSVRIIEEEEKPTMPKGIGAHELLQMVYRGEVTITAQQMQAAKESIAYEKPKLTAVAHFEGSFYEALEQAIEKRANRPPPSLLIEAKPVEPQPAEVLKKPFSKLRRV
jgi:hypothetical protein